VCDRFWRAVTSSVPLTRTCHPGSSCQRRHLARGPAPQTSRCFVRVDLSASAEETKAWCIIICLHFQRRLAASINEGARPARAALVAALNEIIFPVPLFLVTLHDLRTPSPVRHFRLSFVVSSPCSNNRPSPGESTLRKGSDCSPGPAEGLCVGTINRHP